MPPVVNKLSQWIINSTWFKKNCAIVGAFCAGVWFQSVYWREISATLIAWGIEKNEYTSTLLLIIGASGISISIMGSVIKQQQVTKLSKKLTDTN